MQNNGNNYKTYQVLKENSEFGRYVNEDGELFVKTSRFSYIGPIYGTIRLIVYNYSNIIWVEGTIHRGSKVIQWYFSYRSKVLW